MLKLNRKVEYSLLALEHINQQVADTVVTSKEIAEAKKVPEKLLSKILQNLTRDGWIESVRGVQGGYRMAQGNLNKMSLIKLIENSGEKINLVNCMDSGNSICPQAKGCEIKTPITRLQGKIYEIFSKTSVGELISAR
jgi:Rrf2 family cysteine metabolism transcriptional repressor